MDIGSGADELYRCIIQVLMKQCFCKSSMMIRSSDAVSLIDPRKTAYPPVCSIFHPNAQPHVSINSDRG